MVHIHILRKVLGSVVSNDPPLVDNQDSLADRLNFRKDMAGEDDRPLFSENLDDISDLGELVFCRKSPMHPSRALSFGHLLCFSGISCVGFMGPSVVLGYGGGLIGLAGS